MQDVRGRRAPCGGGGTMGRPGQDSVIPTEEEVHVQQVHERGPSTEAEDR